MNRRPGCVSAVVVTFQSSETIAECTESLLQSPDVRQIILVDNASTDGTLDQITTQDDRVLRIRNPRNVGFGSACNMGAKLAEGKYLLFLNPDALLEPDSLAELISFLDCRVEAACCGPAILDKSGVFDPAARRGFPTPLNAVGRLFGIERLFPNSRTFSSYTMPWAGFEREMRVDSLLGACMLMRRSDFESIGGFDEDFFLFGEDIDICRRLALCNREVWFVPSATLMHHGGVSMTKAPDMARREFYRAMEIYWKKHRPTGWSRVISRCVIAGIRIRAVLDRAIGH